MMAVENSEELVGDGEEFDRSWRRCLKGMVESVGIWIV
jgi:hypothetical protein